MGYKVTTSGEFIELALEGQLTLQEYQLLNQEVTRILDDHPKNAILLIDAMYLMPGYQTAHLLQETQKYMNHRNLGKIIVVSPNKLTRLIMLIAFSLCNARLIQMDSYEQALKEAATV